VYLFVDENRLESLIKRRSLQPTKEKYFILIKIYIQDKQITEIPENSSNVAIMKGENELRSSTYKSTPKTCTLYPNLSWQSNIILDNSDL